MYINPYSMTERNNGRWLRANFHTHAGTGPNTCGELEIDKVVETYRSAGYEVLTISNHDLFSDVSGYQEKHDMTLINGFEYSDYPHMLCIGNKQVISGSHQQVIDECLKQGGFVILCHPNWQKKEYWPYDQLDALTGYTGIEIYNGVIFRLSGSGLATDTWDYLLSQGKLVWGFGSDDFHRWFDMARAWNMIYSVSRKHEDVMAAIRAGSFYVSTGLILDEYSFDGSTVKLSATSLKTYVRKNVYRFIGKNGEVLSEQMDSSGEYKLSGKEPYVRAQVISEHGAMLWTQPIYNSEYLKRP